MTSVAAARARPFRAQLRFDRNELSGAFADSGVLLPLAASLIAVNGLNPTVVFVGAGLFYMAAALHFRLPMPVQPLKAFSAIAIALALSPSIIAAGALLLGAAFLLLRATGLIGAAGRVVPLAVVKGIQVSLGIVLLLSAWSMVQRSQGLSALPAALSALGTTIPIGVPVAVFGLALALVLLRWRFAPASLVVLLAGAGIAAFGGSGLTSIELGPVAPEIVMPSAADWWLALTLLVIPQLPLSIGNAMISTQDVARSYFGRAAERVTLGRLAASMGVANIAVGLFAGMPMCHGAGGLTAHHRFGARTGAATLTIGAACVVLGVVFGRSALDIITHGIPPAILGALLAYVGWEHIQLARELRGRSAWATCSLVALTATATASIAAGVLVGLGAWYGGRWAESSYQRMRGGPAREG